MEKAMEHKFFTTDFQNILNITFHENPPSGRWVLPCREMERHDEVKSLFTILQLCL